MYFILIFFGFVILSFLILLPGFIMGLMLVLHFKYKVSFSKIIKKKLSRAIDRLRKL